MDEQFEDIEHSSFCLTRILLLKRDMNLLLGLITRPARSTVKCGNNSLTPYQTSMLNYFETDPTGNQVIKKPIA